MIEVSKNRSGGGSSSIIGGSGTKVYIFATLTERDAHSNFNEGDFCQVLNLGDGTWGYFERQSTGSWLQIQFKQTPLDADYLILSVGTHAELTAAITALNNTSNGGEILFKCPITLTSNISANLDKITIRGRENQLFLAGYSITITSRTFNFDSVYFTGGVSTGDNQKFMTVTNTGGGTSSYQFNDCRYYYLNGTNSDTKENIEFNVDGSLHIKMDSCLISATNCEAFTIKTSNTGGQVRDLTILEHLSKLSNQNNFKVIGSAASVFNYFYTDSTANYLTVAGQAVLTVMSLISSGSQASELLTNWTLKTLWQSGDTGYAAYKNGFIRIMKYTYITDATKFYEEHYDYDSSGTVITIQKKDDVAGVWKQEDYSTNGIANPPTITTITAWRF